MLTGVLRTPYSLSNDPIRLSSVVRFGAQPDVATRFTIWKHPLVDELDVSINENDGQIREVGDIVDDDRSEFELLPNSLRMPGAIQFPVIIRGLFAGGVPFGPHRHQVVGRISADAEWAPESVLLFAGLRSREPVGEVRLSSRTGATLEMVEVVSSPDFVTITVGDDRHVGADGEKLPIRIVEIRAVDDGSRRTVATGRILLRVRSAGDPVETLISIPVTVQSLDELKREGME